MRDLVEFRAAGDEIVAAEGLNGTGLDDGDGRGDGGLSGDGERGQVVVALLADACGVDIAVGRHQDER